MRAVPAPHAGLNGNWITPIAYGMGVAVFITKGSGFIEELRRNRNQGSVQLKTKKTSGQSDQPQNFAETQDESPAVCTPYVMFLDAAELL